MMKEEPGKLPKPVVLKVGESSGRATMDSVTRSPADEASPPASSPGSPSKTSRSDSSGYAARIMTAATSEKLTMDTNAST